MRADNSSHLAEAAQQSRVDCIERVRAVLGPWNATAAVTVAGVAARAGVSRPFLYDDAQAPLPAKLRQLANKRPPRDDRRCLTTSASP